MIPELVATFDRTLTFMQELVADLSDEDMVLQPEGVPNHAAWTLGHVVHSCEAMASELGVESWLPADWETNFGYGSSPGSVNPRYTTKPALLASLQDAGKRLRSALLRIDERTLSNPLPDEKAREVMSTIGHALVQVIAAHTAFHAGQLAAWRRAIGRQPVGTFL
jgi:hypothetical protein